MTWLSPIERRVLAWRAAWEGVRLALILLLVSLLDRPMFHALFVGHERRARLEASGLYELARAVGYYPAWLLIAAAVALHDRASDDERRGRAWRLLAAPAIAGVAAEVLKLVVSRQRPINNGVEDGAMVWGVPLSGFLDGHNLGMPSSHAAVAFAGACTLAWAWRGVGPVVGLAAAGCALTRLLSGAHFLSDVVVGGFIGYAVARALRPGGWLGHRPVLLP